jgi:hypothetical protein
MNIQNMKVTVVAAANNSQGTCLAFSGRGGICTSNLMAKSPATSLFSITLRSEKPLLLCLRQYLYSTTCPLLTELLAESTRGSEDNAHHE